ncbi:hypothetical protein EDD62_1530 [Abyssicoccus albus]|uniref:Sodium:proton antiporter n=2 Tax=Abyssicoccus albus TaxID=1817405 RepID=A0A3N5C9G0_9BACL|nr:hypothetical protein EDD62_1530 [Abyssicoccus albus]
MFEVTLVMLLIIVLSIRKMNIVLVLTLASIILGFLAHMDILSMIETYSHGIMNGAEIALSYALLGGFAALISYSGVTEYIVMQVIEKLNLSSTKKHKIIVKIILIMILTTLSMMSQNLIPIHIAFIPIVIPPMLSLFNELQMNRKLIAVILTFGLTFPYMLFPFGFGQIYHKTIQRAFIDQDVTIPFNEIFYAMLYPALGMLIGLVISVFVYNKDRKYRKAFEGGYNQNKVNHKFNNNNNKSKPFKKYDIVVILIAIISMLIVQLYTDSMIFGALCGILSYFLFYIKQWSLLDSKVIEGMQTMAYISMIMLSANGFSHVLTESGKVKEAVNEIGKLENSPDSLVIFVMLIIGLVITLGIGSSFATIPIIGSIFIPLGLELELSLTSLLIIVGTAGALGDAGSPSSDSTLGPTAGLNMDGQHDHINDTCIPTFIYLAIPLFIFGWVSAVIFA